MELTFSEEQIIFRNSARDFMTRECPTTLVRELEQSEKGYSIGHWRQMAELGWLGLCFPEQYGGNIQDWLYMAILYEEMGRAAFPSPHLPTVVVGGQAILEMGTNEQRSEILTQIAAGMRVLTLAHFEPGFGYQPESVKAQAIPDGNGFILNGTKLFVSNANAAQYFVYSARTKDGITLFLVDQRSPGIELIPLKTISEIGHDKQFEVVFDGVKVGQDQILGKENKGWALLSPVLDLATVVLCAEMVGGAMAALEMAVAYSKKREAFGHPIGSYQALQHKMANMSVEADGAWLATYQAAWMLTEKIPCSRQIAIAKAWTSDAYRKITAEAIQIHGAYGFCDEVDTTLYYRRAKSAESAFGPPRYHRGALAMEMGL